MRTCKLCMSWKKIHTNLDQYVNPFQRNFFLFFLKEIPNNQLLTLKIKHTVTHESLDCHYTIINFPYNRPNNFFSAVFKPSIFCIHISSLSELFLCKDTILDQCLWPSAGIDAKYWQLQTTVSYEQQVIVCISGNRIMPEGNTR